MTCARCKGKGTYRDPQCVSDTCAHQEREVLEHKEVKVETKYGHRYELRPSKFGGPIMVCPVRVCLCPAGKRKR